MTARQFVEGAVVLAPHQTWCSSNSAVCSNPSCHASLRPAIAAALEAQYNAGLADMRLRAVLLMNKRVAIWNANAKSSRPLCCDALADECEDIAAAISALSTKATEKGRDHG